MQLPTGSRIVSVVIPCLNEAEPIAGVVADVRAQGVDCVIVVDNGSTDETGIRAAAAGATVVREARRGYGRACAAGVAGPPPEQKSSAFWMATAATSQLFCRLLLARSPLGRRISLWDRGFSASAK